MNLCQSCGMPMENENLFGTLEDGTKTNEFCTYCYQNGKYTIPEITMDSMINICVQYMKEEGMNEQEAREILNQTLPNLKRWK
ncbi:MAG: zinc ribbon domain-containing protein [Candidatus Delongbacteria bacterium]|nr:zinc ribbon domain-containing protein [Candidatus Delongbacteria bacterium]MBN2835830.1 zinc ribbon domain-containing protein [Candidatus Delongbacteria bacterium]